MSRTVCRHAVAAFAIASALAASAGAQTKPMRVLFIGNSYTYFNNLPATVGDLAMAAGEARRFEPTVVLVGGSTIDGHLQRGDAAREIARGGWDAVVVQDQSMRPIAMPDATWRDADAVAALVRRVGARLYFYETWAREATPELQDSLSRTYHRAAERTGGTVVHAGDAWGAFRKTEAVPAGAHSALFFTDGSHPSTAGTYLAAATFFAALYGRAPTGLPNVVRSTHVQPSVGPAPDSPRDSIPRPIAAAIQRAVAALPR
jgi:hypothetical protein